MGKHTFYQVRESDSAKEQVENETFVFHLAPLIRSMIHWFCASLHQSIGVGQ